MWLTLTYVTLLGRNKDIEFCEKGVIAKSQFVVYVERSIKFDLTVIKTHLPFWSHIHKEL